MDEDWLTSSVYSC